MSRPYKELASLNNLPKEGIFIYCRILSLTSAKRLAQGRAELAKKLVKFYDVFNKILLIKAY